MRCHRDRQISQIRNRFSRALRRQIAAGKPAAPHRDNLKVDQFRRRQSPTGEVSSRELTVSPVVTQSSCQDARVNDQHARPPESRR